MSAHSTLTIYIFFEKILLLSPFVCRRSDHHYHKNSHVGGVKFELGENVKLNNIDSCQLSKVYIRNALDIMRISVICYSFNLFVGNVELLFRLKFNQSL
jgi:hypothetical protein